MIGHARAEHPAECCGLLLGRDGRIVEAVPAANLSDDLNRYVIDPKDHIAARRAARERGHSVVGFYHSHPHSEARPSPTDIREASYPDLVYAIVGLASEPPDVRLFRLPGVGDEVVEIPLEIV
ncbi:MAG TPA: M67 family metallopeptidase [Vicinamibacterales bacterium]|jgi:proteasome lid subunit RPN8/RPN11|nr:M67 family metallopeptidase [Vicinamibacterales bacterium]